jgi:hypothetical protein
MMIKKLSLLMVSCLLLQVTRAQNEEREANLKAAFIYNFTKYIDWDVGNDGREFMIGVIGTSPIMGALSEITRGNAVSNKRIVVKRINTPGEIRDCQLLFIPKESEYSLKRILEYAGKGVLVVGEREGYATRGVAFNFVIVNDKLKFEANLKAIDLAGLKVSSQLLKLAIIVD